MDAAMMVDRDVLANRPRIFQLKTNGGDWAATRIGSALRQAREESKVVKSRSRARLPKVAKRVSSRAVVPAGQASVTLNAQGTHANS